MIEVGDKGWVPENEELIKALAQQLGRSAFGAVAGLLMKDPDEVGKYSEDLYVSALLINRLGVDSLIGVVLDDNASMLSEVHASVTTEQIKEVTKILLAKIITDYSAKCKEGDIPDQLKDIPVFDYRVES